MTSLWGISVRKVYYSIFIRKETGTHTFYVYFMHKIYILLNPQNAIVLDKVWGTRDKGGNTEDSKENSDAFSRI